MKSPVGEPNLTNPLKGGTKVFNDGVQKRRSIGVKLLEKLGWKGVKNPLSGINKP
jgi:hypothetical protein